MIINVVTTLECPPPNQPFHQIVTLSCSKCSPWEPLFKILHIGQDWNWFKSLKVEDKNKFSTLNFMKSKFKNRLQEYLPMIMGMYT